MIAMDGPDDCWMEGRIGLLAGSTSQPGQRRPQLGSDPSSWSLKLVTARMFQAYPVWSCMVQQSYKVDSCGPAGIVTNSSSPLVNRNLHKVLRFSGVFCSMLLEGMAEHGMDRLIHGTNLPSGYCFRRPLFAATRCPRMPQRKMKAIWGLCHVTVPFSLRSRRGIDQTIVATLGLSRNVL